MNKKGQAFGTGVGMFIAIAITIIVGVILFQASAQNVGDVTNTETVTNLSFAAANNTNYYPFTSYGYKACNDVVIYNNTADVVIASGNYTVTNNVVYNGAETVRVAVNYSADVYAGDGWNISCTAQPDTYADGGGRAMAGLIVIFFALAVAMIALYPVFESKILNK
jgi:hypothetical protein